MRSASALLVVGAVIVAALLFEVSASAPLAQRLGVKMHTDDFIYTFHYTASLVGSEVLCETIHGNSGAPVLGILGRFNSGSYNLHLETRCKDQTVTDSKCRYRIVDRIKGKFLFATNGHKGSVKARSGFRGRSAVHSTVLTDKYHVKEAVTIRDESNGVEYKGQFAFECEYDPVAIVYNCQYDNANSAIDCTS